MKIYSFLFAIFGMISCSGSNAPHTQSPEPVQKQSAGININNPVQNYASDLSDIIPAGYSIVQTKEGSDQLKSDLNGDGQDDVAVLIEKKGDSSYDQSEEVLLVIFTADRHRQLQLATASSNLGGASVAYDDGKKLSLRKNVISYHHQSMRHHIDLKFRYEKSAGDFMLIGKDYADYGGMASGPTHISINYLIGKKLINESIWDDSSEEVMAQPEKQETVSKELIALSLINWDRLYDDL